MLDQDHRKLLVNKIGESAKPLLSALENVGYTVRLSSWASKFDHAAGGEINVSSHLRDFWNCRIRLHCHWQTGAIERVSLTARPARTVTLKYSEKAMPGILERIAASFQADIDADARRKQERQQVVAWVAQAVKDTKGLNLPNCLVPDWGRDSDDATRRLEFLHRGMARTPVGRYFPRIEHADLSGPEGLNANQLRYLVECLNKLPTIK